MSKKAKRWSYTAGRRPFTVAVEELEPGGNIYVRVWVPAKHDYRYRSLRHRDRELAMRQADRLALVRREDSDAVLRQKVTLGHLFRLYCRFRTPQKTTDTQLADRRRTTLFTNVLGRSKDPHAISLGEWDRFIMLRRTGAISPHGESVPERKRKPVGDRTVEADLRWLKAVLNWGANWRVEGGGYLLSENPVRGYPIPTEKNPRRPVASHDRLEKVLDAARQLSMEVCVGGHRKKVSTYLREILEIAAGTGRRISAVCQLRYADLRLNAGPYGSIRWPADTDKIGRESTVPVTPNVRDALNRILKERPGLGDAPIFPSPRGRAAPVRYELASAWLREAERIAGVPKQDGSLWHAYRRKWATERKHLPDVDVAAAGGWKGTQTLRMIYQQPDPDTMLKVVMEPGRLRETSS